MAMQIVPRVLRYIEGVARHGSIQAASRELGIAASAIDRQILMLEDDLRVPLFERHVGGMRLTSAGELVLALAQRWRDDVTGLLANLKHMQGADVGHVRLAAMDSHANGLLPKLIEALTSRHPKIILEAEILSTDAAVTALTDGVVDVAVAFNVKPSRDLQVTWSSSLPLGCAVAPDHPLARHETVSLKQISAFPLASQSRSLAIRRYLDTKHSWLFSDGGPLIVTNSLQLVKKLAQKGAHVAITSELDTAPELLAGSLVFIPISDKSAQCQTVSVAVSAARPLSRTAKIVADMLATEIEGGLAAVRKLRAERNAAPAKSVIKKPKATADNVGLAEPA